MPGEQHTAFVQVRTQQGAWVAVNPAAIALLESTGKHKTRVELVTGRVLVLPQSYDATCRLLGARLTEPQPQLPLKTDLRPRTAA